MSSNNQSTNYVLRVGAIALIGGVLAYWLWTSSAFAQAKPKSKPRRSDSKKTTTSTTTTTTNTQTTTTAINDKNNDHDDDTLLEVTETITATVSLTSAAPVIPDKQDQDLIKERAIEKAPVSQVFEKDVGIIDIDTIATASLPEALTAANEAADIVVETELQTVTEAITNVLEEATVIREKDLVVTLPEEVAEAAVTWTEIPAAEKDVPSHQEHVEQEQTQEQEEEEEDVSTHVISTVVPVTVDETEVVEVYETDQEEVFEMVFEREVKAVKEVVTHETVMETITEVETSLSHQEASISEEHSEAESESETPTTLIGDDMNLSKDTLIEEPTTATDLNKEALSGAKVTDDDSFHKAPAATTTNPWKVNNTNDDKVQTLREVSRVAQHSELNAAAPEFKPSWGSAPLPAPVQRQAIARDAPSSQDQQGKLKSRCRFWPKCTNKSCKFTHPSLPCRDPENCSFGDRCVFIHPNDMLPRPSRQHSLSKKRRPMSSDSSATMVAATPEEIWS
ncbi:hypothetical protein BGZ99_001851 [Dissophora globulifera]|uniref:C3H1-type domain-containing protein n=1 Tax=Dissophora globulifera TaxID=979702 RepID=A0A9P6RYI9_9FUNG|nr:hypothetical protein BGZ99_001851 [Dissophora globulifera]